jgi:hypothetical protein
MEEITRYQQLRPVQKLEEESKAHVGLPIYPDKKLSELATRLANSKNNKADYSSIIKRYSEEDGARNVVDNLNKITPLIRSLYTWLEFKAKPIKIDDFKTFVKTLKLDNAFDINNHWISYADNLILSIYNKNSGLNYCIDFQTLIKACYIFRLCMSTNGNRVEIPSTVGTEFLNKILNLPLLLPAGVVISRCSGECSKAEKLQLPVPPFQAETKADILPCECKNDDSCRRPSSHCMCIRPYVADLFIVKEELSRYEAGDIADIENILAGELKVRRHRTLLRSEDTSENENETNTSEERDHQVSEKFTLQDEVKNTSDAKNNLDMGVTATYKYGDTFTITPHANNTSTTSKSDSNSTAHSYAKEVVDRSVTKIQEKIRKLQTSKVINEIEERNKHSIDHTGPGAKHKAALFYWVNKVTHAQVFNYGKHMMFDVIVPEPASIFKKLYKQKVEKNKAESEPKKPTLTLKEITRDKYGDILKEYAISTTEEIQPPNATTSVQFAFSHSITQSDKSSPIGFSSHDFKSPEIPRGYRAKSMDYDFRCSTGHSSSTTDWKDEVAISVNVGKTCILSKSLNEFRPSEPLPIPNQDFVPATNHQLMNGEQGIITLALAGFTSVCFAISGTVSIQCELTEEALNKWQSKIFNLVMTSYNRQLEAFNANSRVDNFIQIKGRNPFLNREIERNEFKRNIIAILICNYFNGIGSMMDRVSPCGYPEIDFTQLERDAPIIQFFEQVFEWEYVTYLFYHSMWARKSKWPELIDEDSGDPLFDKFLMAGAARVQVPIRPGMEENFNWFLHYGQIWEGRDKLPIPGDEDYVSMIQEVKESKNYDYSDRTGFIQAKKGSDVLILTDSSTFYWDIINNKVNLLTIENDIDRELLIDYKVYRIAKIEQDNAADISTWNITIDRPYEGASASNLKHAVGALFVGAPWEIVIPTKLVYLRNEDYKLPVYPLT